MATLSEVDLIRILGEDARAQIEAASAEHSDNPELRRKKALQVIENSQFSASALVLMGVVLFISAHYTQTGTTYQVQNAVAAVSLLGGLVWHMFLASKKRKL